MLPSVFPVGPQVWDVGDNGAVGVRWLKKQPLFVSLLVLQESPKTNIDFLPASRPSGQMSFLKAWIRSRSDLIASQRSICWIFCVSGAQEEEDRYSLSTPAVSLPHWLIPMPPPGHWLMNIPLIDVTDNWPDVPPSSPPPPFHTAELSLDSEWCVSAAPTLETDFKTFRFGVYPAGWLASATDWCSWCCDEKGLSCPQRYFVDEFKQQQSL